jgi:hypothetical protein
MVQQNAASPPVPAYPVLPPGFTELLTLFQNGTLPLPPAGQTLVPPASPAPPLDVPPPTEGRSFTRLGRGQGGALVEKQKVSKQITTSATKRKALVDPDIESPPPSTPSRAGKKVSGKPPAKRLKTVKVNTIFKFSDNY